jgi:hypothetical protein
MLLRSAIFCFLMTFFILNCRGQFAENITPVFKNGHATITYDLIGLKAKETYIVSVYASYNNFNSPLVLVSGDVGKNIQEGKGKKIEWKASEEAGNYKGDITFRINVALLFTPLEFINPTGGAIRRGRTTTIEWRGGYISNDKVLELYKGSERIATLAKVKNVWLYKWLIPKDLEKGNDYTLKLSGGNESLVSNPFRIKRRTPLLLKLSPLFAAAAIIPFLGGTESSGSNTLTLPGAPDPE